MVIYDPMSEAWTDTEDPDFKVGMTPEGGDAELDQEFENQEAFYEWYKN